MVAEPAVPDDDGWAFNDCLGDQQPVEGVAMTEREVAHVPRVRGADRQPSKALLADAIGQVRWGDELAQGAF